MSYHIISIDTPKCTISAARGQIVCINADGVKKTLPLEDIACIVITSFRAQITSNFLIEASKNKISVILCDSYRPTSVLLPVDRASDTELLVKLSTISPRLRESLWQKTVQAKCMNQWALAKTLCENHPCLDKFQAIAAGTSSNKESECAKLFWSVFASVYDPAFRRQQEADGLNALFNYAYAILLSAALQKLLAVGLDPTFGIFHRPREHATPLAYDLMEPFRPIFDANVSRWLDVCSSGDKYVVSAEFRRHIVDTLKAEISWENKNLCVQDCIEEVCRSFRRAIKEGSTKCYHVWKISIIKWVGS